MADIEIEIDGKKLTARPDQTVIQVADEAGIYIPRFCYHKHLTIAANCRMCLVEVEKAPKALPACATPVAAGMKIFTKSPKTIAAQRAVMEFLLINHPLDCPICDQGGECELQDLSMGYGSDKSKYDESKRAISDPNLGPLVATEMTRCIYCTRCVRFGTEVAGMRELGGTYRGEHTEIGTFVKHAMKSEVSGNIIDLCPVGALTSKPYRFTARPWELDQFPSISPHDCFGTNVHVHSRYGTVMRVVTKENADINLTWITDRDRFSYEGLYHHDRLEEPVARIDGQLQVVSWQQAFELAAQGLQQVINEHGADKLGALVSPNSTTEEFYLLQKLVRALGSPHIDHRLREINTQDQANMPAFPGFTMPIADIDSSDAFLLIGTNLQKEVPLAAVRLRRAMAKGAQIAVINPVDYDFNFAVNAKAIVSPQEMVTTLAAVASELDIDVKAFANVQSTEATQAIATIFKNKQRICICLGALSMHHTEAASIRYLAQQIAMRLGAKLNLLTDGANNAGGWLAGAIPHRHPANGDINHHGYSAYQMLEKARKAYLLLNVEPELDCANSTLAVNAMKQAKFIVALSTFRNPILDAHANVIFPTAPFTETSGTFVNAAGTWQSFKGVAKPFHSSRPGWKILRVLANFLQLDGFDYESSEEVKHELKAQVDKMSVSENTFAQPQATASAKKLIRIGEIPIYAVDNLVRRSEPLQIAQTIMEGDVAELRIHPETASEYRIDSGATVKVKQQHETVELRVVLDERIAPNAVWIAGGIPATTSLGDLMGEVEIN